MPRLSVWFVRASLIYFLLGFTFGALVLAEKGIPYFPRVWNLIPVHIEFLLMGWFVQLAMGVAFWIFPRFSSGSPRAPVGLVWLSFALLNTGILITALQLWFPHALLIGRVAEVGAGILFALGLWRRIKPHGAL
jgi:hypothetical protein